MNTILIIIGIIAVVYTILRICLLIGIEIYNTNKTSERTYYELATNECVGINSDFCLLPSIELTHNTNYFCIYYKWFCFYYYIDFRIQDL